MMNKKRAYAAFAIAAVIAGACSAVAMPAQANEGADLAAEAPMTFVPMTRENAAAAGYEVRTNPDGTLYGVPIGAPDGSHEREVRVSAADSIIKSRGTVSGNCGYATVDFLSKSTITTSYRINPSFGLPVSHNWQIMYSSRIDLTYQMMSGIPSWGSQSWAATAGVKGHAAPGEKLTAMASGSVLTSWGYCTSGNPTASITF
ncbi:hypothetical protein [Leifsonia sp. EB34]|uniref:hypothetical protein n=1 Tax=Leifsonia sp. EB34 TaxID=3156303 RepID=UPI0035123E0E